MIKALVIRRILIEGREWVRSKSRVIHLIIKPEKGGSPAKDKRLKQIKVEKEGLIRFKVVLSFVDNISCFIKSKMRDKLIIE